MVTQLEFVEEWFRSRQGRAIPHSESKPALESEYFELTGKRFEDPDKAIRHLFQAGKLIRPNGVKGVYQWNERFQQFNLSFSELAKAEIMARDGNACFSCKTPNLSDRLYVLPRLSFELGGGTNVENGVTMCLHHALIFELSRDAGRGSKAFKSLLDALKQQSADTRIEFWSKILENAYADLGLTPSNFKGVL